MEDYRGTARNIGDVYRHIYRNETSSRQMVAADLGISLPTVTQNLNYLRECGLIFNAGEFESTGGRKANMLSIVPEARLAVGMDVTQTHVSVVLTDLKLNILDSVKTHVLFRDADDYYEMLANHVRMILEKNEVDPEKFLGVGISLPAIVNERENMISYSKVIDIPDDFYVQMQKKLPYPVRLFNDANAAGWTELQARGKQQPMVYLSLSNSVGGAVLMNRVYTGRNWRGGEFGHMTIVPNGKECYCGRRGCLNAYCSARVLSDYTDGDIRQFFYEMKATGNRGYRRAFEDYMQYLALAVNNLRMCFDCDVVLGGMVGACMEDYIDEFKKIAKKLTPFENSAEYVKICSFRTEPSAVGAALYFVDDFVRQM
ncbi:ROK family transcriptional regulator [Marvinbryantia sp.]|uniref:ROK family transcriptional regulator n=1 Tax=Marvinbryantia sp. TaxID=2496532 RepID=UPI0025CF4277|nr:ROK family transcriptional regulator [uncultured Marvinbryantia sp.]